MYSSIFPTDCAIKSFWMSQNKRCGGCKTAFIQASFHYHGWTFFFCTSKSGPSGFQTFHPGDITVKLLHFSNRMHHVKYVCKETLSVYLCFQVAAVTLLQRHISHLKILCGGEGSMNFFLFKDLLCHFFFLFGLCQFFSSLVDLIFTHIVYIKLGGFFWK